MIRVVDRTADTAPTCDAVIEEGMNDFARCGCRAVTGELHCLVCEKVAFCCGAPGHQESAHAGLMGHLLLVHPDQVPELVEAIARDPERLAATIRRSRRAPQLFAKLMAALTEAVVALATHG